MRAASLVVGDVVFCFDGPKQLDAIDDLEGDFEVQAGRLSWIVTECASYYPACTVYFVVCYSLVWCGIVFV